MNKLFKTLSFLAVIALFATACGAQVVQARPATTDNGKLPFSLTMQDTMASVQQKLGQPKVVHALQAGWEPGLPDGGGSPDHIYYWAVYKRFGITIIYNTPSANDSGATIHEILFNE